MSGEFNTYSQFISSNKHFFAALNSNETCIDDEFYLEVILLYLKTKIPTIKELSLQNEELLLDILENNNYTIEGDHLIYKNISLNREYFTKLAKLVHDYIPPRLNNVIEFKPSNVVRIERPTTKAEIIYFDDFQKKEPTYEETSSNFNLTFIVDKESKKYIRETKKRFSKRMDHIIECLLTYKMDSLDPTDLEILSGLLDIFALDYYLTYKPDFLDGILLPTSRIGLGKSSYPNVEIKTLEKKVEKAQDKLREIDYQERYIDYYSHLSETAYQRFESQKNMLGSEVMTLLAELHTIKKMPQFFNPYVIKNIMASIKANNVDIKLPKIRFFTIDGEETTFHCSMSIETFKNLIKKEDEYQLKKK